MGTPAYMAPEQADGRLRDIDPRTDVYSLGVILYVCLTGRPPFEGPYHVVLTNVLNTEPLPPSRRISRIPADLETICLKCLRKEPAQRYASAEALQEDLDAVGVHTSQPLGTQRGNEKKRLLPSVTALLLLLLIAAGLAWWKYRPGATPAPGAAQGGSEPSAAGTKAAKAAVPAKVLDAAPKPWPSPKSPKSR